MAEEYRQELFEKIGQKDGKTTNGKYGEEHYEELGQKGSKLR